jgi:hypothetical protein
MQAQSIPNKSFTLQHLAAATLQGHLQQPVPPLLLLLVHYPCLLPLQQHQQHQQLA